uniref:WD_REPEATS_REGION domain-containing protein n=1 Tax=Caenorhabditis japonica TaxID=281687 RepID=A0A8R1HL41_CAEJA
MPRKCIHAVLVSWCEDKTSRIWKELPPPETSIIDLTGEGGGEPLWDRQKSKKFLGKHIKVKKTKNKILNKLKSLLPEKRSESEATGIGLRAQIGKSPSSLDFQTSPICEQQNVQFHLAATINAETDCLLVPSLNALNVQKFFCVHWLNNKELVFSVGAEKLLAEAVLMDMEASHNATNGFAVNKIDTESEEEKAHVDMVGLNAANSVCSDTPSSKDILDVKLEILLRQWNKTSDVLFAIHPVDGSLLTWTVEWLDDNFRQPVVSYSSRLPSALPSSDSMSLHSKLNTFNPHEPVYLDALRSDLENRESIVLSEIIERRVSNTIHVLTSHDNGTLNLWHMSVDDQSCFSHVVSMTHISRMCGHRFQMQQIVAHPVLPLMLTTSKFNPTTLQADSSINLLSEVILWKTTPIGPLCKKGGIREIARVASPVMTNFSIVSWVPVILPSCTLGTVCNSPSSCFISFNGTQLIIYQAVLDARGLFSELSHANDRLTTADSENVSPLLKKINVVSTQSTAKPGCVLEVGRIEDTNLVCIIFPKILQCHVQNNANIVFFHIFQSRIVISEDEDEDVENSNSINNVIDRSQTSFFKDKFFLVMVDQRENEDVILMFSLTISFSSITAKLNFETEIVCQQVFPLPTETRITNVAPAAGHLSSASLYPACETPYVLISSDNEDSVRFWRCISVRDANNSNKHEWREWNMIGDNHPSEIGIEGKIVAVTAAHSGRIACVYEKSRAHESDQIAVEVAVLECESSGGVEWFREDSFTIKQNCNLQFRKLTIGEPQQKKLPNDSDIFNSMQQRLNSPNTTKHFARSVESSCFGVADIRQLNLKNLVRLAWVSTEAGSHMLTVGIGTNVHIYVQISKDPAQQNVTLMKESETTMRRASLRKSSSLLPSAEPLSRFTRWIQCRLLTLETADGLPPIPTSLSWVRDGILIIGLQSEMRVYNQWNFTNVTEETKKEVRKSNTSQRIVNLTVSTSHSMLDHVSRKKEALLSSHNRIFINFGNSGQKSHANDNESQMIVDILKSEGVFEAARLSSPILPQYHPKQLIVLLNAGKKQRVKAILGHILHTLKQRKNAITNPISKASFAKKIESVDQEDFISVLPLNNDEEYADYDDIEDISLLPLYALSEDEDLKKPYKKDLMTDSPVEYDELFTNEYNDQENDIDEVLKEINTTRGIRSRNASHGSEANEKNGRFSSVFTARDNRKLTEFLTHTHLPGLSSVDQMHLLAIANTLSHFSNDAEDKLEQVNAASKPVIQSGLGNAYAGGYATASNGTDSVDECGLKYLMAVKQHEYLLLCLPLKQRLDLKKNGLSAANIIWAQHSETETELLNILPGMQKENITWDELRGFGVAWWLKNTNALKTCIEKLAKSAFQLNQDPMDASLFYLAMRKKNVLTHLFKTIRNQTMADFFMNDFNTEHWKKVAAKNAFVLMSKQRFQHAAAFFLLSGSLKDAVQTILSKCNDLQLALVVVRLYESELEKQQEMINTILCREVLGISIEEFETNRGKTDNDSPLTCHASKEPFERSMAFWMMRDYTRAAHTLVQEAQSDRHQSSLSDIFNFYSYLRKHPLVIRQRLNSAGAQIGSTEKFLALGKQLENILTPPERRLFFRTAAEHMAHGCPMLSLDVLTMLPKRISVVNDYNKALQVLLDANDCNVKPEAPNVTPADWSVTNVVTEPEEFEYKWSDDEEEEEEDGENGTEIPNETNVPETNENRNGGLESNSSSLPSVLVGSTDIFAQHMKFVASLRILTEELSTLASGLEKNGGKLRNQLLNWLQKEIATLKLNCDYNADGEENNEDVESENIRDESVTYQQNSWLVVNQKLLRTFTSFCTLHSAHNSKMASVLMELLLLLLHVQKGSKNDASTLGNTFPLFEAVTSSQKMFVSSPLAFIENQCFDLLSAINELTDVSAMTINLRKCYMLYNLSQGFSCCLYHSLCDIDQTENRAGISKEAVNHVATAPVKWPGLESLIASLGREKDEDAPQLRLLIIESFLAIFMSLFCFAFSAYDSRWLYRLSAHEIDPIKFGYIFGGGGELKKKDQPPALKPPRPAAPNLANKSKNELDGNTLRSRLNLRVLGSESSSISSNPNPHANETMEISDFKWVPPQKNIVQFFAEKPYLVTNEQPDDYESDEEDKNDRFSVDEDEENRCARCENDAPSSFAWQLLRLALIQQQLHRVNQFLVLVGIDPQEAATVAPRVDRIIRQLNIWIMQQHEILKHFPGGIPSELLPDMTIDMSDQHLATSMKKYASLVKKNNTPFESDDKKIQSIQRLWSFLVKEDHLQETFIKYIFSQQSGMDQTADQTDYFHNIENSSNLPDAFKIVQKDSEPIVAFSCNQERAGLIVVSNGRELQEMDMSEIFRDQSDRTSWMWNRADLDIKNMYTKRDALRDNDDYQIFTDSPNCSVLKNTNAIIKRNVVGVRRIDSHPHAPFYVTGSSDGSIKVWRWGTKETIYTARVAGQHAKVTKIAFSSNGNKFAAVDGDGMLCLWQASHSTEHKKPYFSQRCHNKTATDVRFLGHSSSVLLTAGSSSLDYNLGLWDTLLPNNRALVHSWVAHPEGATCAMYIPSQQTIFTGGRSGEICLWDIRQRQLRQTIKAFDQAHTVKNLVTDSSQDLIVSGSSEGDIKIWSADSNPQLMYTLPSEHSAKGGFSFRQVGQSSIQGVQQLFVDQNMRLFSCGADSSLKFRKLPSIFNMTNLL